MDDFYIEVEISREQHNHSASDQHEQYDDQIGSWKGEPRLSKRQKPPTPTAPVVEIQTSNRWLIVRVPSHVRVVDELAYKPKILSIGPLHHDEPSLKAMEAHKQRFLNRLQGKIASQNIGLGDIESAMKILEHEARNCYSEEFEHINSNDFVAMLVLDASFVVELLRLHEKAFKTPHSSFVTMEVIGSIYLFITNIFNRLHEKAFKGQDVKEPIFGTRWMLPTIGRDLLMLENQLPMFILQKVYDLTNFSDGDPTPLEKLALQFFRTLRPFKVELPTEKAKDSKCDIPHLLGLFQSSFVLSSNDSSLSPEKRKLNGYDRLPGKGWVNNATRLNAAGISFRAQSDDELLTIEFKNSLLKIPTLLLDDGTGPLLRNLLAYEQSNRYAAPYFTSLAVFLDSIVDTPKDVDILRNAGIIKQAKGGNDEIVGLLNRLTRELEFDMEECCYMSKQIEDINNFCRSLRARMCVMFATRRPDFMSCILTYISLVTTF